MKPKKKRRTQKRRKEKVKRLPIPEGMRGSETAGTGHAGVRPHGGTKNTRRKKQRGETLRQKKKT